MKVTDSIAPVSSGMSNRLARRLAAASLFFVAAIATASNNLTSPHAVKVDPDAPHPALLFSDVLKSMSDQVFWEKGKLRFFERVRFTFLPDFNDPNHIAAYNPNSGAWLISQIANDSGEVVQTIQWEARRESFPIWVGQAVNNSDPDALAPGDYTATWTIDGQPFWALEFSVENAGAASAYEQGHFLLEGPWADWAYVYVPNGNLGQTPTFNLFIRDAEARPGNWTDQTVVVEVFRDDELVAQHGHNDGASRPASIVQARPWWVAHEFSLRRPDDAGFVAASELTAPGEYEVQVTINGEPWGSYYYQAEGELPRPDRQDRGADDPMDFLEGLTDRFYIQREN